MYGKESDRKREGEGREGGRDVCARASGGGARALYVRRAAQPSPAGRTRTQVATYIAERLMPSSYELYSRTQSAYCCRLGRNE